jgi:hypothetical protein
MNRTNRSRIGIGLVLVLIGAWLLAAQFVPALQAWTLNEVTWPLAVIGVGVLLAVVGLVTWAPGLMVPACIVGGIGGLLYWQNTTGNWESWAYAWTLIPGFVGVGVFLSELLTGKVRQAMNGGGVLIIISLVMFLIFSSFLGGPSILGAYWPVLLILLGLIILAQVLFRPR